MPQRTRGGVGHQITRRSMGRRGGRLFEGMRMGLGGRRWGLLRGVRGDDEDEDVYGDKDDGIGQVADRLELCCIWDPRVELAWSYRSCNPSPQYPVHSHTSILAPSNTTTRNRPCRISRIQTKVQEEWQTLIQDEYRHKANTASPQNTISPSHEPQFPFPTTTRLQLTTSTYTFPTCSSSAYSPVVSSSAASHPPARSPPSPLYACHFRPSSPLLPHFAPSPHPLPSPCPFPWSSWASLPRREACQTY
jgi:hypothetical protein